MVLLLLTFCLLLLSLWEFVAEQAGFVMTWSVVRHPEDRFSRVATHIVLNTPNMRQSNTILNIDERRSKLVLNNVLDCRLSPVG